MRVLVTGGTGHLGGTIVSSCLRSGHQVRVLARTPGDDPRIDWVRGDLATGEGLWSAVAGVDVVVHAATHSPGAKRGTLRATDALTSPKDVDVEGTASLLHDAERAGVDHVVHVSIVGLEHMRRISAYARVKIEAERLVEASSIPWTIARATPFYWLLEHMFATMSRRRTLWLPDADVQPCDAAEFGELVAAAAGSEPAGRLRDFAGPERRSMLDFAASFLEARGIDRLIRRAPLPRPVVRALESGSTSADATLGTTTWATWLGSTRPTTAFGLRAS